MAQISSFKALASIFIFAVAMYFASVEAQELAPTPAPPALVKGAAAYSVAMSGPILCSSLLLSLLAFLKH